MGADDANEGDGQGECVEHVFVLEAVDLGVRTGAQAEYACTRCGLPAIETGDQLTGRRPPAVAEPPAPAR